MIEKSFEDGLKVIVTDDAVIEMHRPDGYVVKIDGRTGITLYYGFQTDIKMGVQFGS